MYNPFLRCTAFAGPGRIASGELRHVALKAKQAFDAGKTGSFAHQSPSGIHIVQALYIEASRNRWIL